MKTSAFRILRILGLAAAFVLLFNPLGSASPTAAAPNLSSHEPCTGPDLNPDLDIPPLTSVSRRFKLADPFSLNKPQPVVGEANLTLLCAGLDKTHYMIGDTWQAVLLVYNAGDIASSEFSVTGSLCRFLMDGSFYECQENPTTLTTNQPPLPPGEFRLIQSGYYGFDALPEDENPNYASWRLGVPDSGTVNLRATVNGTDNYTAHAIYPTAPDNIPNAADPNFVDADGDGWSPEDGANDPIGNEDCDDNDPNIHPFANEIAGNSVDDDCVGGDPQVTTPPGCSQPVEVYYGRSETQPDICNGPPGSPQGNFVDIDGDGYNVSITYDYNYDSLDCDDNNGAIHPGAPEILDHLDNNCNGLVDEDSVTPDWAITSFEAGEGCVNYYPQIDYCVPGLYYLVEINNVGQYVGSDLSHIKENFQFVNTYGPIEILRQGLNAPDGQSSGIFYYGHMGDAAGGFACQGYVMLGIIPFGLFGEEIFDNNVAPGILKARGPADLSLTFKTPVLYTYDEDSNVGRLNITVPLMKTGSCPPLPHNLAGDELVRVGYRKTINNVSGVFISRNVNRLDYQDREYRFDIHYDDLEDGDIVCVEFIIDIARVILEKKSDNRLALAFEYEKRVFGAGRLHKIQEKFFPSYPLSIQVFPSSYNCEGDPVSSSQTLVSSDQSQESGLINPFIFDLPLQIIAPDDCLTPTPETQAQPNIGQGGQVDPQLLEDDPCNPSDDGPIAPASPPEPEPDLCLLGPGCVGGIPTGALIGMLLLGGGGFFGGRFFGKNLGKLLLKKDWTTIIIVGSTIGGLMAGYIGGAVIQLFAWQTQGYAGPTLPTLVDAQPGLPSCDAFLDPKTASPSNFAVFEPNEIGLISPKTDEVGLVSPNYTPIMLGIDLIANNFIPEPSEFLFVIASPADQNASLVVTYTQFDLPVQGGINPLVQVIYGESILIDLGAKLHDLGYKNFFSQTGEYQWYIAQGQTATGGDLLPFQTFCQGSTSHSFVIGDEADVPSEPAEESEETGPETPTPTNTVVFITPTATVFIPTPTFTSPPPTDTSPPSVGGMNASPNPTLTTNPITVTANISDPSGVMNVVLYYSVGKGPYQFAGNMKPSGGNTYSLKFGPLTLAGSYTYRILAQDSQGNVTCTSGTLGSCPGGSFVVNIP